MELEQEINKYREKIEKTNIYGAVMFLEDNIKLASLISEEIDHVIRKRMREYILAHGKRALSHDSLNLILQICG